MAGQIKKMIDVIVDERSKGNKVVANSVRTKLILKGINIKNYNENSPDDPVVISKLKVIAKDFGVNL